VGDESSPTWDIGAARNALGGLRLAGTNVEVAQRWLALWQDGAPPSLTSFDAQISRALAPAIAIFEIRRNTSLVCLRAGEYNKLALGFDMTGQSLLSLTNNVDREDRLDWCWKIVEGAATVSYREIKPANSAIIYAQGLSLPFCDRPADGQRYFFSHTNWRPNGNDWIEGNVDTDLQSPRQRAMRSFAAVSEEAAPLRAKSS
jgi:hypothetical protein